MQHVHQRSGTRNDRQSIETMIGGERALLDCSGALVLPDHDCVAFADLHFEKGSSFAERGALLPPYDSATTLDRMEAVLACYQPRTVICLGDSFHDTGSGARMARPIAARLKNVSEGRNWLWILGNHDPEIPENAGGTATPEFVLNELTFLHETYFTPETFEVSGHFHPKARIKAGPRRITRACFIGDSRRLILPSFGAYTGGLDIRSTAIAGLFPGAFTAYLLSKGAIYAFPSATTRFVPFES